MLVTTVVEPEAFVKRRDVYLLCRFQIAGVRCPTAA